MRKGFGLNELLNIHNSAKVVNVKEPEAGTWTVKVLLFPNVCLFLHFGVGMFYNVCTIIDFCLLLQSGRVLLLRSNVHRAFVDPWTM